MRMPLLEHRVTLLVSFALLTYFLWMDVALYHRIQNLDLVGPTPSSRPAGPFSPFTGLSVKMIMMDQVNNYVHAPLADIFNQVSDDLLSGPERWIPVSFLGMEGGWGGK